MNRTSATIAAILSFILPGLGHAYLGRRRAAIVFALPTIAVLLAILLEVIGGVDSVLANLITPSGAMTVLVLVLLTGAWRIIAMVDAVAIARRSARLRPMAIGVTGALVAVTLMTHGAVAYMAYTMYDAGSRIFVAGGPDDIEPTPGPVGSDGITAEPTDPGDEYLATPMATPETVDSRINILLTGVDSAESRSTSLTDTLLLVSVNPADGSVVMLSFPRDISNFPMYDGGTFTGKINSLMTYARNHKKQYPDGPFPTLINEIGYLAGVPIHYYAAIDLDGFRRMINEVGGVTVDNERAINDPRYDWMDGSAPGFYLKAGKVKLNGRTALAFARSRQGVGDNDFTRAARQQQLLVALRDKLVTPEMITSVPALVRVAGDTIRTNLPTDRLQEFITLAREVDGDRIQRYVLGPPYAVHPPTASTGGTYTLRLRMDRLAKLSRELFGSDSRYAED